MEKRYYGRFSVKQRSALMFQALQSPMVKRGGNWSLTPVGVANCRQWCLKVLFGQEQRRTKGLGVPGSPPHPPPLPARGGGRRRTHWSLQAWCVNCHPLMVIYDVLTINALDLDVSTDPIILYFFREKVSLKCPAQRITNILIWMNGFFKKPTNFWWELLHNLHGIIWEMHFRETISRKKNRV